MWCRDAVLPWLCFLYCNYNGAHHHSPHRSQVAIVNIVVLVMTVTITIISIAVATSINIMILITKPVIGYVLRLQYRVAGLITHEASFYGDGIVKFSEDFKKLFIYVFDYGF